MRALLLCLLSALSATAAEAATDDTVISITYKTSVVRIKPQPVSGVGGGDLHIVLHANGTVDDVLEGKGDNAKKWELKKHRLGSGEGKSARYRVIDTNTIERTFEGPTHVQTVKIVVNGKTCTADVDWKLNPGQKYFLMYSPQLGKLAHYSEMSAFDVECKIE